MAKLNSRFKHRGVPKVNSKRNNTDTQRMVGKYVLHPTKGWRKVTPVNMDYYTKVLQQFINRQLKLG